ncbi:hypothetical protein DASC09_022620 [Saccharomycopsis crataegensis]|uniref:Manganese resistance protein MNR2 n=1 Tax=Saccharomycopsis crataegensis TaxID=43959 RepID=A0AAV5QK04_9ASCO|nr:hypothetical protein DASC09_022620 [Saccharomycopsis crataegensis]
MPTNHHLKANSHQRRHTFSDIFNNDEAQITVGPSGVADEDPVNYGIIDQRVFTRQKKATRKRKKSAEKYKPPVNISAGKASNFADNWLNDEQGMLNASPTNMSPSYMYMPYSDTNNDSNPSPAPKKYSSFSFQAKRGSTFGSGFPANYDYINNRRPSASVEDNLDDLFDSDYEFEGSQPSTKNYNDNDNSSIDDVCLPIDQSDDDEQRQGPKIWPDLRVLQEYYDEEVSELKIIDESNSREAHNAFFSNNNVSGTSPTDYRSDSMVVGFQNPIISKVDESQPFLKHHHVDETEGLDGRLRAPRINPWDTTGHPSNLRNSPNRGMPGLAEQFRFAYFREDLDTTIHASTISGILQPGQTFADLFVRSQYSKKKNPSGSSVLLNEVGKNISTGMSAANTRGNTPVPPEVDESQKIVFWLDVLNPTDDEMKVISKSFGIHPLTTEDIMLGETREKVELFNEYYFICFRSFDIVHEKMKIKVHKELTNAEEFEDDDNLPFLKKITNMVNKKLFGATDDQFRRRLESTFSKDAVDMLRKKQFKNSSKFNELRPLNIYIVVFKDGLLTFHFAPTPHPVNVRRRCRLLKEYLTVSTDWIAYALIDDITDAFGPMIELVEVEVAAIEDEIIKMQSAEDDSDYDSDYSDVEDSKPENSQSHDNRSIVTKNSSISSTSTTSTSSTSSTIRWQRKNDMLRRIGEARKKVMSLSRLLSSKADVIKGFSKKCNESFVNMSPSSEIGMYLGDIQDHIITMVQSLNHCEKLLARSHSNYLAQINIDMTKVNNDMNDVLGKLTMLGTIVLPLNVCTGLWGMNVIVPGQEHDGLVWFNSITMGMVLFALVMYIVARRIGVA